MKIDFKTGLLDTARQIPSPNYDERPVNIQPELIVIHNISLPPTQFGGDYISQLFTNCLNPDEHPYFAEIANMKVSAHSLIRRDGSIIQYVPFQYRAWHAGQSNYCGRLACNDFSIGIELEGTDHIPYTDIQYASLTELVQCLLKTYPSLSKDAIAGHNDIAPGRKTDPGSSFDWQRLRKTIG